MLIAHITSFKPTRKQILKREEKVAKCIEKMGSSWLLHPYNHVDKIPHRELILNCWKEDRL